MSPFFAIRHFRHGLLAVLATANVWAFANPSPQQFSLHFLDLNPRDTAAILAADPSGNFFVVAISQKAVLTPEPPASVVVTANIHVTKTDGSGNVLGSFDFGGSGIDTPTGAAVDASGNLTIVGATQSPDFPLVSPLQTSGAGFVTKIDAELQTILFSTRLGVASASAVAVDAAGNIYVTGVAGQSGSSSSFTTTPGVLQPSAPAPPPDGLVSSGFIMELSAAGDKVIFSTYFAGSGFTCYSSQNPCVSFPGDAGPAVSTKPSAIAVDGSGNVIISGSTDSNNLPVSATAYAQQCGCTNMFPAGFVAKLTPGGSQLVWGTYIPLTQFPGVPGDLFSPTISAMALDASGNVVLAGNSQPGFPVTQGAFQTTYPVPASTESFFSHGEFVAKLSASGSRLLFATYFGEDQTEILNDPGAVAVDGAGTIWLTGSATLGSLPAGVGTVPLGTNYIAGLASDGSGLVSLFTVPSGAAAAGIAITPQGTLAALGSSGSLLISSNSAGPSVLGIVELGASSVSSAVCGRELIALYGSGIGPASGLGAQVTNGVIGNSLGGVQVFFDGVPAALLYAGPTQINAIIPSSIFGHATTAVEIVTPSGTIDGPVLSVQPTAPQVLTNSTGGVLAMNQDGSLITATNAAPRGSIVTIWLTGGGAAPTTPDNAIDAALDSNPFPVSVLGGNQYGGTSSLDVSYAGDAPGLPSGVIQVNFQLPVEPFGAYYQVQVGAATSTFSLNVAN